MAQDKAYNNKPSPPYWRIITLLNKLRLKRREREKGSASFHITVPDFGIVFRFNTHQPMAAYKGWDIIDITVEDLELNDLKIGENLMWLLISKGYMSYLRDAESGNSQIFRHFLINEGWGQKIIDKRLELYNGEPRHKYQIERNKRLQKHSPSYVLMYYPDFYDYLW